MGILLMFFFGLSLFVVLLWELFALWLLGFLLVFLIF